MFDEDLLSELQILVDSSLQQYHQNGKKEPPTFFIYLSYYLSKLLRVAVGREFLRTKKLTSRKGKFSQNRGIPIQDCHLGQITG